MIWTYRVPFFMQIYDHLKSIRPNNSYLWSPRDRSQVNRALATKNIKVGRHEVEIIRRFDEQQYADFLLFCDREITCKRLGTVRIVFTSIREMFDVDFKRISIGDSDIRNGVLNFGYVLDRLRSERDARSGEGYGNLVRANASPPHFEVVTRTKEQEISPVQSQQGSEGPKPGDKDYEEWVDRNELAMSKFYDKSTRIFAYICRLSRGYQVSVLEGIDRVFENIPEGWKGQKVNVVDAGVGGAYFLEKFMQRARKEELDAEVTAIDLSKAACATAKAVIQKEFADRVTVTKGNLVKMTRFLEDSDPVKPGSQKLVFLNYVLQYVPIERALAEINQVLEVGGRLLITNFKPKESMRWNEFWTNFRAAWECGKNKKFGHGRFYEFARYLLMFLRHAVGIVKFAMDIDRDVRNGIIPENPNKEQLMVLFENYGFKVLISEDTHQHAALRFYVEKVRNPALKLNPPR